MANAIAGHIGRLAHAHRICEKPDLHRIEAIQAKARRFASRLSGDPPDLLGRILDEGRIQKQRIFLLLKADGLAEALGILPDEIDHSVLAIEAPFELRRRGVEGKIIVGDREPQPDRTLLRALSQAHAWTADLRRGKPLSKIAVATRIQSPTFGPDRSWLFCLPRSRPQSSKGVSQRT